MRLLRFGRVDGGLPEILSGEELVGAGHVVFGQQFALHLEQAFRITHVAHQVAGDFRQLVVLAGKIFSQALMTGSDWSHTYRSTEPSYASTVAFTELRM